MSVSQQYNGLEIAIIGLSGKFPGSCDYRQFWHNLKEGRESLTTFTNEELMDRGLPRSTVQNPRYVKTVGVVDNKDYFDSSFFGYTPEESHIMDPQIRLFHQLCWHALEDAGYASLTEKYKIGLFAGASANDNWKLYAYNKSIGSQIDPYFLKILMDRTFIATMVAYKLNLRGPAFFVDTACSTSLAAVHMACRSLLTRDCSLALAGGICLGSGKWKGYFYQEGMISSKDGHCRTFDSQANGTAVGEGAGIVVLKRLSEAIKDGDHIYSIIRATSANNDGKYKVGYTAPGVNGQAECITTAQKLAGIDPLSISYIEAHGTATRLGDPIEIKALNTAFDTIGDKFCAVGSVKTNIGHLDIAAGIAGLIKTTLSLKHKQLPASLHFNEPNPEIEFDGGPFYVNTKLKKWHRNGNSPLRAGVSSFGIGGTNVHAIMEEAPEPEHFPSLHRYKLLTISAKTETSLVRYQDNLKEFLMEEPEIDLADMAYTLQTGRKHFGCRKSIVFRDREELIGLLDTGKDNGQMKISPKRNAGVVFMFPGQGSQYEYMGIDLYQNDAFFKGEMDGGFSILKELTGEDFREILFPDTPGGNRINQTKYTQPLLFLLEYSLARLMMSLGVVPRYMIGHSIGEYVAACISGVFTFEDGLRLVVKRGEQMNSLPEGTMFSIPITASDAQPYLNEDISLAAINGPEQIVLSGNTPAMEELTVRLKTSGTPYIKLHTSHAFHSGMQDAILDSFEKEVKTTTLTKPSIPFISNLTGEIVLDEQAISTDYWTRHLRETVNFSDGLKTILSREQNMIFIEVGAGHSLTGLVKQQGQKSPLLAINLLGNVRDKGDDEKYFTNRIGQLWSHGMAIDWKGYYKEEKRTKISLPVYSFEPTSFPAEVNPFESGLMMDLVSQGTRELKDWIYYPVWQRSDTSSLNKTPTRKTYLFFSDEGEITDALKAEILQSGCECIEVRIGDHKIPSKNQYTVNPADYDSYKELFLELKNNKIEITDIIYGWGMRVNSSAITWDGPDEGISRVYFRLIDIIRALSQTDILQGKKIWVLTGSLYKIIGTEKINNAQSLLVGLINVIPQEYQLPCVNIDLDLAEQPTEWAAAVTREINKDSLPSDRIIAFRLGEKWVQDYQRHFRQTDDRVTGIRKTGIYMITGGLGNLGFTLAKYLLTNYQATLILTGRSRIEENEQASERFDYLKSIGGDVRYFSADVSELETLKTVVETVERTTGSIQGVIHAAGNVNHSHFELLEDITVPASLKMFAPKIKGIENIYALFRDRTPDFVWIASSLAAMLGGLGFASYSSANLYMDLFIAGRSNELSGWKSLDLPELKFGDQESKDKNALDPTDIGSLFEWSLSFPTTRVILVNKGDLAARIEKTFRHEETSISVEPIAENTTVKQQRPAFSTAYIGPQTEIEKKLIGIYESFFGIEPIGIEDDFLELGGDSLKGMILVKKIKKEFNVNLNLFDFLLNISVRKLAEKIDEMIWFKKDVEMDNEITI